jgi:hypothetical protein
VPSSTEWAFGQCGATFQPTTFFDVSESLETKLDAMAMYKQEQREFPHPRSSKLLEANARKWGSTVGVQAAEAFQLIWRKVL